MIQPVLLIKTGHAHDVRKVAAALRSLTNPSLDDVLVSGDWSSPDTFFKHYFFNIDREVVSATGRNNTHTLVAGRNTVLFSNSSQQGSRGRSSHSAKDRGKGNRQTFRQGHRVESNQRGGHGRSSSGLQSHEGQ